MSLHPTRDWVAVGSEDTTVNVWQFPRPGARDTKLLLSVPWRGCPVTGVAFGVGDSLFVVPYDQVGIAAESRAAGVGCSVSS